MADLKTNLLGFVMNSPIIGASGTVGYGVEYEELADFSRIGGISGKGLTLHGQYGNKGERLWETPSGLINSIGLQNPGVQHFIDVELKHDKIYQSFTCRVNRFQPLFHFFIFCSGKSQ